MKKKSQKSQSVKKRLVAFALAAGAFVLGVIAYRTWARPTQIFEVGQGTSPFGQSLALDGNGYIIASSSASLNANVQSGFTVEAWIRPETATYSASYIVNKTSGSENAWALWTESGYNSGEDTYYVNYYWLVDTTCHAPHSQFTQIKYRSSEKAAITAWHHVAGVVHPGGKMDIFVDGKMGTINANSVSSACQSPNVPVTIGARVAGTPGGFFRGQIEDVHIATVDKYIRDFAVPTTPLQLTPASQLLYHFDGTLGDVSPAHRDGIMIGSLHFVPSTLGFPSPRPSVAPSPSVLPSPSASCKPRPACLDARPRCMIPETEDMCPRATKIPAPSPRTSATPLPSARTFRNTN